ncbi:MAG: HAD hydrolase-like protein [Lachnospiraceae bacterium]|nr:HAD hydrolase-like protein [Lachnospiraceae bacterium]
MVGDKWIDVLAGFRYGVNPIFVLTGEGDVEYNHKKSKQIELPERYEVFDNLNTFIREKL